SRRVSYPKRIVLTFFSFRKARNASIHPVGVKNIFATCKNLMAVGLVAYIPHQLVVRGVKNIVEGNRKFHHTQAGAKMAAIHRYVIDNKLPKFFTKLNKLGLIELFKVGRAVNLLQ